MGERMTDFYFDAVGRFERFDPADFPKIYAEARRARAAEARLEAEMKAMREHRFGPDPRPARVPHDPRTGVSDGPE